MTIIFLVQIYIRLIVNNGPYCHFYLYFLKRLWSSLPNVVKHIQQSLFSEHFYNQQELFPVVLDFTLDWWFSNFPETCHHGISLVLAFSWILCLSLFCFIVFLCFKISFINFLERNPWNTFILKYIPVPVLILKLEK